MRVLNVVVSAPLLKEVTESSVKPEIRGRLK
jgi:hypothetical protein